MSRHKLIALRPEQYKQLYDIKQEVERRLGAKLTWGTFLIGVFAGGIITDIVKDIIEGGKK